MTATLSTIPLSISTNSYFGPTEYPDDNEGGMSASNILGMMMMQQRSEQSSRDADRTAREAELALRREEITMRCEEMATQMAMQR